METLSDAVFWPPTLPIKPTHSSEATPFKSYLRADLSIILQNNPVYFSSWCFSCLRCLDTTWFWAVLPELGFFLNTVHCCVCVNKARSGLAVRPPLVSASTVSVSLGWSRPPTSELFYSLCESGAAGNSTPAVTNWADQALRELLTPPSSPQPSAAACVHPIGGSHILPHPGNPN